MKFLVAIHRPTGYDGSLESAEMGREIDALNEAMHAAGARFFAGGLQPPELAKSLRAQPDGSVVVTNGPYLVTDEFVGGFWILECANIDEAVEWGKKAVAACRAEVEVRPFF